VHLLCVASCERCELSTVVVSAHFLAPATSTVESGGSGRDHPHEFALRPSWTKDRPTVQQMCVPEVRDGVVGRVPWFRRRAQPRRAHHRFSLWGPVPYYRTRTRRGTDVSVGGCGCCLPIPLFATLGTAAALRAVWQAARR
jgi:hypothetical protein